METCMNDIGKEILDFMPISERIQVGVATGELLSSDEAGLMGLCITELLEKVPESCPEWPEEERESPMPLDFPQQRCKVLLIDSNETDRQFFEDHLRLMCRIRNPLSLWVCLRGRS